MNYIYRKETTSKLSIHYESCHPIQHKLANFRFLLNRLNKIPLLKNDYKKEFNNIISIASFNKVPIKTIYMLNNRIKNNIRCKKYTKLNNNKDTNNNWASIQYCGDISDKVKRIFNNNNINISYKTTKFIQNRLKNRDHKTKDMSGSGIYQLDCECGARYIGKTSRKFKQRYQEHRHNFIYNNPERSKFASHLLQYHHSFMQDCFEIIKTTHDNKLINIWEQYEIYKPIKQVNILMNNYQISTICYLNHYMK
mgnify:CR=1 FL=1